MKIECNAYPYNDAANNAILGTGETDKPERANGNDRYVFRRGDGQNRIEDFDPTTNTDTLKLIGIAPGEISGRYVPAGDTQADLRLDLGQGESVTIAQALDRSGIAQGRIERIEFDDGTVWTVASQGFTVQYAGADDTALGYAEAAWIDGGAGNDRIVGGQADDRLEGGVGKSRRWWDGKWDGVRWAGNDEVFLTRRAS